MRTSWVRHNGDWAVKVEDGDYPEHMIGSVVSVTSRSGRKSSVILVKLAKSWMVSGGRHVEIYMTRNCG